MASNSFFQTAAYIWSLADLLRGDFRQTQYGRVILPFTVLRRLECVLEGSKAKVLKEVAKLAAMKGLEEEAREKFLLKAAGESFYNTSPMNLSSLGSADIKSDLLTYVENFSKDARKIFEHFKFADFVGQLEEANLLFKVVQKVASTDLSPEAISNYEMGLVFEELIRRFAESSNETAGEHFTPRDIVRLTTSLVFMEDSDALTAPGIICTIYDPTAGTGSFLSGGTEHVHERNPTALVRAFGQELNPESYAICKGNMLLKGQDASRIKLGNTLSDDQLYADKFDYMLSNPPFGVDWKKVEGAIKDEHKLKGFDGRFGAGLPRVSDGSLLFLLHLISKMRDHDPGDSDKSGSRIGIILNGSHLSTGGAGSGESEIRRSILESDLLEAIVALPTDVFYHTGIATYVWVLSNKKAAERIGKVQLINAAHLYQKLRKSLGSKRQELGDTDIALITRAFGSFEAVEPYSLEGEATDSGGSVEPCHADTARGKAEKKTFGTKILESYEFGYRRITVERPLRLSVQFTDERLAELRFESGPLNAAMRRVYELYGQNWTDESYGMLADVEEEVRALIKAEFKDLKEKPVKDLLAPKAWNAQKALLEKAVQLQAEIGTAQFDDFNEFEGTLGAALEKAGLKLETKQKKQLLDAVTWANPDAEPVIKKVLKTKADPVYGAFEYRGQVVQFRSDPNLRDNENVPLTAETARGERVDAVNEDYLKREVTPGATEAWIDSESRDGPDGQVGVVGYEVPFLRLFMELPPNLARSATRLKTILSISEAGEYEWSPRRRTFGLAKPDSRGARFSIDESQLDPSYLALFLSSPETEDWVRSASVGVAARTLPLRKLVEHEIHLPSVRVQRQIVELAEERNALLERIQSIGTFTIGDPARAETELSKYRNATNRFEEDFTHILPHPLSVLWVKAHFARDEKTSCQEFVHFYEYFGLFALAVVLGALDEGVVRRVLARCGKGDPQKPNVTMGTAHYLLHSLEADDRDKIPAQFRVFVDEDWTSLLKEATAVRNDIAHRGLHAKASVHECKVRLDSLNDRLTRLSRDLFEQVVLVSPTSTRCMENHGRPMTYLYAVELMSGLALNPSISAEFETSAPMLDGELYMLPRKGIEAVTPHRLFPFVKLMETDALSGISAFYFYNRWDAQLDKYVFACPYPNPVPQQHLSEGALFLQAVAE